MDNNELDYNENDSENGDDNCKLRKTLKEIYSKC
jgi:hypothetical protein